MDVAQCVLPSPLGKLYLSATGDGLSWISTVPSSGTAAKATLSQQKILDKACAQLNDFFAGKRVRFDIPLDIQGTDFQKRVWKRLLKIPFGTTVSYRDIALKIKNPKACRAVGSAIGKNPLCIVIPCHRVIAADGSLGGYSLGLKLKRYLLRLEQDIIKNR